MNQTKMKDRQFLGMTRETFFKKYGIIFILLLMVGIMLVVSPTFRTYNNVLSIMQSVAVNGCLALGMVFVITAGLRLIRLAAVGVVAQNGTCFLWEIPKPRMKRGLF